MPYSHERDEWRRAINTSSELSRAANCGHDYNRHGICRHCGDDEPRKDAW